MKMHAELWLEDLKGRDHLEDLVLGGKINIIMDLSEMA
jgi:hypothetical protein